MLKERVANSRFVRNVAMNSGSMFIYTIVLQLVLFPFLSRMVSIDRFGQVLAAVATINGFGIVFGGAMAQLILKEYGETNGKESYSERCPEYNGNMLLILLVAVPLIALIGKIFLYRGDLLWVVVTTEIFALKIYFLSEFRVAMNYVYIAGSRMFAFVGYAIGFCVFWWARDLNAMIVFFIGELTVLVFVAYSSEMPTCGIRFAHLGTTLRRYGGMFVSMLSNNIITYGDRFILAKAVGFGAAPLFFAAAIGGRLLQMPANTFSNVVLSHIVNADEMTGAGSALRLAVYALLGGGAAWVVLYFLTPLAVSWLYPHYFSDANRILQIVNVGFAIKIAEILVRPVVIKFVSVRLMALLYSASATVYLIAGALSAMVWGLKGFAISFVVVNLLRFAAVCLVLGRIED